MTPECRPRRGARRVLLAAVLLGALFPAHADSVESAARILAGAETGDRGAALATLRDAAGDGDARAARWLGDAYHLGRGVATDDTTALDWWRQAAHSGDAVAAFNAGLLMLRAPAQAADGRELLAAAADAGDVLACFVLGTWHARHGETARARARLECAARQGYAPAQYNLARVLATATPPEIDAARTWYAAAAPTFAPAATALAALPEPVPAAPVADPGRAANAAAPAQADWVLAQRDDAYTIQVGAGSDGEALARMLREHASAWPSAWFLHRPDAREPYSAVVGVFDGYAEAETALAALPAALTGNAPWIRRFEVLKRELRTAAPEPVADPATTP